MKTILFLEPQPCIRALKYAKSLKWKFNDDIRIVFGYLYHPLNELYGYGDEFFDKLVKLDRYNLQRDIKCLVKTFHPFVVHSHNAPDLLTVAAIEAVKDEIPIIHDCHEALTLRETPYYSTDDKETVREKYPREEKTANEQSDARIYVTEGVRDYIQGKYDVDPSKDIVFYSYICESMVPNQLQRKLSEKDSQTHIVYIGTVTSKIEDSHYDLRDIFREIADQKLHLHLYVSIWGDKDEEYHYLAEENEFIHYHGHLDQRRLLMEISQYDFGWAGFNVNNKNRRHLDVALPNKIFEYIGCGLPILAFPHKNIKEFIEKHKVGIILDNVTEISSQLTKKSVENLKRSVMKQRYKFTVENNIKKIVSFLEQTTINK